MTKDLLIGVTSIVTLGIAAMWLAWRARLPSILLLLVVGFVAGPITGFLDPDVLLGDLLFPVVSISVGIILFEGGLSLRFDELREIGSVVRNLVTWGALLTWWLIAGAAVVVVGMGLPEASLLGAILVVTGPTVIVPLLRHVRPVEQVASTLKWEGILNDPIGAILAVLVFEVLLVAGVQAATAVTIVGLLKTLAIGAGIAASGAGLLILIMKHQWAPDFLQSPLSLMVVVTAFAASNVLQPESGLLTVTVMGVILANQKSVDVKHIVEFKENLGVVLISGLFIILAARLEMRDLSQIGVREIAFLATLMLIVRPTVVGLATIGSGLSWRERAFIGWVAPRGIVAAAVSSIFALELARAGYAEAERLVSLTFLVIIGTVAVYGISALPLARWLGLAFARPQGTLILGAHAWARSIGGTLKKEGIAFRLVDTNYSNISASRLLGLPVYYGSALNEEALDDIDLEGIGRLLALSANDEVNALAALHFSEIFGRDEVYQLPPEPLDSGSEEAVSRRLRGRYLFDATATYEHLTARFAQGATITSTNLTHQFDYAAFTQLYPEAIPLFLIGEESTLRVFSVKSPPSPSPGDRLVAIVDRADDEARGVDTASKAGRAEPKPVSG